MPPDHRNQPHWGVKPLQQTPMGQEQLPEVQQPAEDFGPKESIIPGMNKLRQAGEGMQRQPSQAESTQSFPMQSSQGNQGAPISQESFIPRDEGIQTSQPQQPRMDFVRKQKGGASAALGGLTPQQQIKHEEYLQKKNAPYEKAMGIKNAAADEILHKAGEMKQLLLDPESDVAEGAAGKYLPLWALPGSQRFSGLSDDVAAALTGLQSGIQTISKIRFNKERKPDIWQDRQTQIERTDDLLNDAARIKLEQDVYDFITNSGYQANTQQQTRKIYDRLSDTIPVVSLTLCGQGV